LLCDAALQRSLRAHHNIVYSGESEPPFRAK
jgi:hypothetical protein